VYILGHKQFDRMLYRFRSGNYVTERTYRQKQVDVLDKAVEVVPCSVLRSGWVIGQIRLD
jgi:hypothetical protein